MKIIVVLYTTIQPLSLTLLYHTAPISNTPRHLTTLQLELRTLINSMSDNVRRIRAVSHKK